MAAARAALVLLVLHAAPTGEQRLVPVCLSDAEIHEMPESHDIPALLAKNGPSLRQDRPASDGVVLIGYRNTDENDGNIDKLLSAQGIPFHIARPDPGWKGQNIRLELTVQRKDRLEAEALLSAAARAGVFEQVEGFRDLLTRF